MSSAHTNMTAEAIAAIEAAPGSTAGDLLPAFPGCTIVQVRSALRWARAIWRLRMEKPEGQPMVYYPAVQAERPRPPNSVFELGSRA